MLAAIEAFHAEHPKLALEINVTRHPYSFVGDRSAQSQRRGELDGVGTPDGELRTFAEQMDGRFPAAAPRPGQSAEEARRERMRPFLELGAAAGIGFDLDVVAQYQPIESQRLLLWAGRFGKQEEYMSALNRLHFERRSSASVRATVLAAAAAVELDVAEAEAFLRTDELEAEVWQACACHADSNPRKPRPPHHVLRAPPDGETIRSAGIRSIPLFALSVPSIGAEGGPFRQAGAYEAYVVRGSSDAAHFLSLLELIARDAAAGARKYDAAAFPYRKDEWWAASAQRRVAG